MPVVYAGFGAVMLTTTFSFLSHAQVNILALLVFRTWIYVCVCVCAYLCFCVYLAYGVDAKIINSWYDYHWNLCNPMFSPILFCINIIFFRLFKSETCSYTGKDFVDIVLYQRHWGTSTAFLILIMKICYIWIGSMTVVIYDKKRKIIYLIISLQVGYHYTTILVIF